MTISNLTFSIVIIQTNRNNEFWDFSLGHDVGMHTDTQTVHNLFMQIFLKVLRDCKLYLFSVKKSSHKIFYEQKQEFSTETTELIYMCLLSPIC